jgi:iron complex transport system substrate-binding protein
MLHRISRSFVLVVVALAASVAGSATAAGAATPQRVVALTPFSANTMALLGKNPVAVGQALGGPNLFAPQLKGLPILPLTHPNGPNMEQIAKLNADFVFTSAGWERGTASMKQLGLRVANREPRSVSELPAQSQRIGKLIGKASIGKTLRKLQEQRIHAALAGIKQRPTVLLVLGVGSTPYAFLPNSWGGDVITRAGGRLITGGLTASDGYARISDEFVVAKNPDVIIAVPHGNPQNIAKIAAALRSRPGWRTTRAARNKRLYISTDNTLLQPLAGADSVLRNVRKSYLHN